MAKIDMFMAEVLIPLAAQTHAVVLCDANSPGECMLSASFLRMYAVVKAKWTGLPPFSVISMTNNIAGFYNNPDEDANWRNVRRASRAWRQRDGKLLEVHGPKSDDEINRSTDDHGMTTGGNQFRNLDLDINASCVIITDCINPKRDKEDGKPFNVLRQALVRHLSSAVPSLAIKTGSAFYPHLLLLGSSL